MAFKTPEIRIGSKDFQFYYDRFMELLLERDDTDVYIRSVGGNCLVALKMLFNAAKKLENPKFGSIKVRYGRIVLGEKEFEDRNRKVFMEIPCKIIPNETQGYIPVRNLDQNPWQGDVKEVDDMWRDELMSLYFDKLAENGQISIFGYDFLGIDAIKILNILQKRMIGLDVTYQNVEVGYLPSRSDAGYGLKIDITAKEKGEVQPRSI
jgi:hypothetical protein